MKWNRTKELWEFMKFIAILSFGMKNLMKFLFKKKTKNEWIICFFPNIWQFWNEEVEGQKKGNVDERLTVDDRIRMFGGKKGAKSMKKIFGDGMGSLCHILKLNAEWSTNVQRWKTTKFVIFEIMMKTNRFFSTFTVVSDSDFEKALGQPVKERWFCILFSFFFSFSSFF